MSAAPQARFHPNRLVRRLLGPIFGAACLLATCTGVVVLALLLGSVVAAALRGRPSSPGMRSARISRELFGLVRRLATSSQSTRPDAGRLPGRDRGQPLAAGPGRRDRNPGRRRGRRSTSRSTLRPGGSGGSSRPTSPTWPACRRSSTASSAWRCSCGPSGIKALALGPTLLAGVLTLSLLILPIIVITTQEALRAVPQLAPPGGAGAGRDAMAGGPRPRPALGAAGHLDRHDPRALAGDRRDGPALDGRRGRLDPPAAREARSTATRRCRSRSTITPSSRTPSSRPSPPAVS